MGASTRASADGIDVKTLKCGIEVLILVRVVLAVKWMSCANKKENENINSE